MQNYRVWMEIGRQIESPSGNLRWSRVGAQHRKATGHRRGWACAGRRAGTHRSRPLAQLVSNDLDFTIPEDRHAAVSGSQVDADGVGTLSSHPLKSRYQLVRERARKADPRNWRDRSHSFFASHPRHLAGNHPKDSIWTQTTEIIAGDGPNGMKNRGQNQCGRVIGNGPRTNTKLSPETFMS